MISHYKPDWELLDLSQNVDRMPCVGEHESDPLSSAQVLCLLRPLCCVTSGSQIRRPPINNMFEGLVLTTSSAPVEDSCQAGLKLSSLNYDYSF